MRLKSVLIALSLLMLISFNAQAQDKYKEIDIEHFITLSQEEPGVILDARTEQEYNSGHIPGAVNINYYDKDAAAKMLALDKNLPVYVYCQAGGRARSACGFLAESGFKSIYHIKGDMIEWKKQNRDLIIVKDE